MSTLAIFGITSSLINVVGFGHYFNQIYNGKIQPHILSWIIWSITISIATLGAIKGDGGYGVYPLAISVILHIGIVIFSLRFGFQYITLVDKFLFAGAVVAILILILDKVAIAILITLLVDGTGYLFTIKKAYTNPSEESASTFVIFAISNLFAIFALTNWNFLTLPYLLLLFVGNVLVVIVCLIKRARIKIVHN